MPCRSDYMEPTAQEAYNQRTAQVMVTAACFFEQALGFQYTAREHASNPHCAVDLTADLCAILKEHDTGPA